MYKSLLIIFTFLIAFSSGFAQNDKTSKLIKKGIEYYEQNKIEKAIKQYNKALKRDSTSAIAKFHKAVALFSLEQYEEVVSLTKTVIKSDKEFLLDAYILLGSSLDYLQRSDEAISVFEKARDEFPRSHLPYFNLGISYGDKGWFGKAKEAFIQAIKHNPAHATSHLALAYAMLDSRQEIEAMLSLYTFLLFEPSSPRSVNAYNILDSFLQQEVSVYADSITNKYMGTEGFERFELMSRDLFATLFNYKDEGRGFWWDHYVAFYQDLFDSNLETAFLNYISTPSSDEKPMQWIESHPKEIKKMKDWVDQYNWGK